MLWNINVSVRTKVSLFLVLGLGGLVTACAVMRLVHLSSYGSSGDWLYDTVSLAKWSMLELTVSIIAGSLPSLRPLVRCVLGGLTYAQGTTSRSRKRKTATAAAAAAAAYGPGDVSRQSKRWQSLASASTVPGSGGGGLRSVQHGSSAAKGTVVDDATA